jgi:alpha-mannosidase
VKNISPHAKDVLNTLASLDALPAEDWKFHAGDVAHGESMSLDDSKWETVKAPFKAPKEGVWFRREIEVPKTLNGYDITGARVWFQFIAEANGPMPEIIYFNGRRVALGDDLEPIVLFEPAKPGDKILVAVKLLHTVDEKSFRGAHLRIEPNAEGTSTRPNPDDVRLEALAAQSVLPALTPSRRDLLPKVEDAIAAIDMNALHAGDQAAFDASLRKALEILATLHPEMATAKIVEDGNAHIDAAWLWPKTETVDVVKRTFSTALQLMNEYPDYVFTQSAAQYNQWLADKYPDINNEIKERIKQGRWEIVGGMWVEPDLNIPDGESLVRQLLVGQRTFQSLYGVTARIGWNPDSFGYNWQLPQIYKRSGLDYFVTQKMHWNDTNQLPFRLFWWESPDGSKVLTYFPTDYVHTNVSPSRIGADFAESAERNPGTTEMLDLYGVGDHGGGPTRAMLDEADHWISMGKQGDAAVPSMHYGTAQSYFTSVEKKLNPDSPTWNYESLAKGWVAPAAGKNGAGAPTMGLPTWKDELYFEYHRGVYTTQAKHKWNNRHSEFATLDAEKLASLAWLDGAAYPGAELTDSWKKITFNQFHDLAAGSGIAVIYRDAQDEYTEVFQSDTLIDEAAMRALALRADTRVKAGVPVMVFNSQAWPRSGTVEVAVATPDMAKTVSFADAQGRPMLSQPVVSGSNDGATHVLVQAVNVPAMGYTVTRAESGAGSPPPSDLTSAQDKGTIQLANSRVKMVIDRRTGCITSLEMLPAGTEFLAANGCGNQLQTFVDTPKNYDAWNIDPGTLDKMTPITEVDEVTLVADGPVRKTVRVARHWQSSKFVEDISLDAGADLVRVDGNVDWHETHVLLKAGFPLAATSGKATFEIPYGSIERPTTRNNSFEKAKFEVPAQKWADLGDDKQGVSLINDAKYGYDAVGNWLRLTLLRSPTWPDPNADRGEQRFAYAIYPHAGSWKDARTVQLGYEFNDPMTAMEVTPHTGTRPAEASMARVESPNVVLTAVKKAEDGDALIFRMYEFAGKASEVKLHVPGGGTHAIETNLMEKPEAGRLKMSGDTVTVAIKPYEILTVEVAYPHAEAAK